MTKQDLPPVPPLTDFAVSRIERGVFAALDSAAIERGARAPEPWLRRWRYPLAMAAAAAAAFAVMGVHELRRGSGLPARGARIATAASPSHITIPGASLDVAPSSAISFTTEHDGAVVVALERGSVTCEVAPRSHRAPFIVEAGATRVTVVGTRFTVARIGDHAAVSVEHGTVEVGDDGLTRLVHAGERYRPGGATVTPAPASAGAMPAPPPAPAPVPVPASPAETRPGVRETSATNEAAAGAPGRRRSGDAARVVAVALPVERRGTRTVVSPPPLPAVDETAPVPVSPPPAPVSPAPALMPAQQRFEAAAGVEVRDPEAALRIYLALAAGSDAWAANALFAGARLEAERGHRDRARALLDAYLQRFPRGPNATDARALLDRLRGRLPN